MEKSSKNVLIHGINCIKESIKSGRKFSSILIAKESKALEEIELLAKARKINVKIVSKEELRKHCEKNQGVIGFAKPIEFVNVIDILKFAEEKNEKPIILICSEIEDPHNLGALCRSAEAAGVSGIIVPKHRNSKITSIVEKASAGAINNLKIAQVSNLAETIKFLKAKGIFVYCAEANGENCYDVDLTGAICLVVGSEGKGVRRIIKERCDKVIAIPQFGKVGSLNVSVAGGILLFEAVRQRIKK